MKRFLLMAAFVVAAPAMVQALGPNDSFIEQIADSNSTAVSRTGSSTHGNGSDIEQISGSDADVAQGASGNLHKSTITQAAEKAESVSQEGPDINQ